MIFLGDVAHPFENRAIWPCLHDEYMAAPVIINLEGPITPHQKRLNEAVLFNHESIVPTLQDANVVLANLANNHMMDWPAGLEQTQKTLRAAGINYIGADQHRDSAARFIKLNIESEPYIFLAFGWETIGCQSARGQKSGTNRLTTSNALQSVRRAVRDHPNVKIIVMCHWNYELELYPQPAHRQLAKRLIEEGAELVVGHHSHLVSGIETHAGKLICYGLGNWWLPQSQFMGGGVKYPQTSFRQLALDWRSAEDARLLWFVYDPKTHLIEKDFFEPLKDSKRIQSLTPFFGMNQDEYIQWFQQNRHKKALLPVYRNCDHTIRNHFKDYFVRTRQIAVSPLRKIFVHRDR